MLRFFLAVAVIHLTAAGHLLGQATNKPLDTNSGGFLYHGCQLRLRTIDDSHFSPTPREAADALMCQWYVQGFTDGMFSSSHDYCPQLATQEQAIRKYVAFMTETPLFLNEDKLMGVALVIQPLYKCRKSNGKP